MMEPTLQGFKKMKSGEVFCPFLKRTLPSPTLNKPASAHFSNCQLSRLSAICSFFLLLLKYSCGQVHKPWALAKTWFKTFCRTWDQECKKLGFFVTKKQFVKLVKVETRLHVLHVYLGDTLTEGSRVSTVIMNTQQLVWQ